MDESDLLQSPRKKQKLEKLDCNGLPPSAMASLVEAAPSTTQQLSSEDAQLNKEVEVGITEFVSPDLPGFEGILKKRYTDFLVNEILPSGDVVHLQNLKAPKPRPATPSVVPGKISAATGDRKPHSAVQPIATQEVATASRDAPSSNPSVPQSAPQIIRCIEKPVASPQFYNSSPWKNFEPKTEYQTAETSSRRIRYTNIHKASDFYPDLVEGSSPTASDQEEAEPLEECEPQISSKEEENLDPAARWRAFARGSTTTSIKLSSEDEALLTSYFGVEKVQEICSLYNRILLSQFRKPKDYGVVKTAVIADRGLRTSIHQDIRRIFSSRFETETDDAGSLIISASARESAWDPRPGDSNRGRGNYDPRNGGNFRGSPQKPKLSWKQLGGEFLHFTLYKENKDTMEVVANLARQLKMAPKAFQFAGTKDRRGVTVQRISVLRVRADRLPPLNRILRGATIGDYQYQPRGLELGESMGNEFIITLRQCQFNNPASLDLDGRVKTATEIVRNAVKDLCKHGYINYYGLQRFGTFATRTDAAGTKMLQGDFKGAVNAILSYTPEALAAAQDPMSGHDVVSSDDKNRAYALHSFLTSGKSYPAIEVLPRKFSAEANIVRHLGTAGNGNDHMGALQTIPRNLRMMYVHAYQSLIWNMAASERWKRYEDRVMEGDLVLVNDHKDKAINSTKPDQVDADGEVIVNAGDDDAANTTEDSFARARALSKEEAESGQYTIFDVVLPTPGYDILYPANDVGEFYKTFMASERGGGLDPYDMRRKWRDMSLSGSYRKLLERPKKDCASFEVRAYTDENEQFVETDMDRIQRTKEHGGDAQSGKLDAEVSAKETQEAGIKIELEDGQKLGTEQDIKVTPDTDTKPNTTTTNPNPETHLQPPAVPDPDSDPDLDGGVKLETAPEENHKATVAKTEQNPEPVPAIEKDAVDNTKIAVILHLQLGSSQYATMALRELMKLGGVKTWKPDFGVGGR